MNILRKKKHQKTPKNTEKTKKFDVQGDKFWFHQDNACIHHPPFARQYCVTKAMCYNSDVSQKWRVTNVMCQKKWCITNVMCHKCEQKKNEQEQLQRRQQIHTHTHTHTHIHTHTHTHIHTYTKQPTNQPTNKTQKIHKLEKTWCNLCTSDSSSSRAPSA